MNSRSGVAKEASPSRVGGHLRPGLDKDRETLDLTVSMNISSFLYFGNRSRITNR